jgi:hypothetical protein
MGPAGSAGDILRLDIYWKGTKDWEQMEVEDAAFLQWAAKRLAREMRERTIAGRLPSGHRVAPLSKRYAAYKTKRGGRPVRDGVLSGSMWAGLAIRRLQLKTRARIQFDGAHRSGQRLTYTPTRGKYKGQERTRNLTNQAVANFWALRTRAGRPLPESYNGRPGHTFLEMDDPQRRWLGIEFERRVILKNAANLPPIKEIERKFQRELRGGGD